MGRRRWGKSGGQFELRKYVTGRGSRQHADEGSEVLLESKCMSFGRTALFQHGSWNGFMGKMVEWLSVEGVKKWSEEDGGI